MVRQLVDVDYPDKGRIVLVMDNLNTHRLSSLYEATPIVGSLSLAWYAWDTVTTGDRPLTTAGIHNIRQVVQGMMLDDAGAVVDWQHPDEHGSIPLRIE